MPEPITTAHQTRPVLLRTEANAISQRGRNPWLQPLVVGIFVEKSKQLPASERWRVFASPSTALTGRVRVLGAPQVQGTPNQNQPKISFPRCFGGLEPGGLVVNWPIYPKLAPYKSQGFKPKSKPPGNWGKKKVLLIRAAGGPFPHYEQGFSRDPYIIHLNIATCKWWFPVILVFKKPHVTQMVARWRSFKEPCSESCFFQPKFRPSNATQYCWHKTDGWSTRLALGWSGPGIGPLVPGASKGFQDQPWRPEMDGLPLKPGEKHKTF